MSKNTGRSQKRWADLTSYSFAEPVVRTLSDKVKGKSELDRITTPSQNAGTKNRVVVFHKRKDKSNDADVLGTRDLSTWKNSSGRSKSWRTCRRLKLTQDYLELLTNSNGHPVSFGWQFSTERTSISFVRGQGLYVNKQSKPRRIKTSSGVPINYDLDEEYGPHWPLLRDPPRKHWLMHQKIRSQSAPEGIPKRFLRLNIPCEAIKITTEASLEEVRLTTRQPLPLHIEERQSDIVVEHFVVLDLVRNENHADVYVIQDPNKSSKFYHAYAFLSEALSGNGSTFMRRKADRLRKSHGFYAETVQRGRKIIVMEIDSKGVNTFHVKNTQREFPPLPGTVGKPYKSGKKNHKRSYAAVVTEERHSKRGTDSNHLAYKAWQERQGIRKLKKENVTIPPNIVNRPDTKLRDFNARLKQRGIPNITLANRFASLAGTGICEL